MQKRMIGTGIPYKLYQDNRETSKFKGQWYARVKAFGTVDLDGLADHIASHGSTFTKADIAGVLYAMQDCILELLLSGQKVRFGDLGTFYIGLKSKPAATRADYSTAEHIEGVRLDFTPSRDERAGLVSTRLKEGVKFINLSDMVGADDDDDPEAGA